MEDKHHLSDDFIDITDNVYEAIMIVAKRARKIGTDQKVEIENALSEIQAENEEIEEEEEKRELEIQLEKPTVIAFKELVQHDLEFEYKEKTK